jgi:hypothetical protein
MNGSQSGFEGVETRKLALKLAETLAVQKTSKVVGLTKE